MNRFLIAASVMFLVASTSHAQQVIISGEAAQAAIIGASLEQGRQFAQDQRAARDRAAYAEQMTFQQAYMAQMAAKEAQQAAGAAAWANMNAAAREHTIQAALNSKAKHTRRAETIKKLQEKKKAKSTITTGTPAPAGPKPVN